MSQWLLGRNTKLQFLSQYLMAVLFAIVGAASKTGHFDLWLIAVPGAQLYLLTWINRAFCILFQILSSKDMLIIHQTEAVAWKHFARFACNQWSAPVILIAYAFRRIVGKKEREMYKCGWWNILLDLLRFMQFARVSFVWEITCVESRCWYAHILNGRLWWGKKENLI